MRILFCLIVLILMSCHEPKQFEAVDSTVDEGTSSGSTSEGQVYPINTGKQICNPAISGDTVNFPSAMLWLGFSGTLVVKDPPKGFTTKDAIQHDRLTISSFDNSVLWFLLKDSVPGVQCEFQDPDWSAHPDWIVSMGAHVNASNCDNGEYIYSGWVIRPKDGARFRFQNDGLDGISTPHAWFGADLTGPAVGEVVDTATYLPSGVATPAAVTKYFGGNAVKFAWSKMINGYSIQYIDYSEASPAVHTLKKPKGRETWKAESAMISPDGNWIAYNIYQRLDQYEAYLQRLTPGSEPILLAENAMDPRWWIHPKDPNRMFLVYVTVPTGAGYIVKQDLRLPDVLSSASAGSTWMQELRLDASLPLDVGYEVIGLPRKIVDLPFRGGRSPDGKWLATGTNDGFMMELP